MSKKVAFSTKPTKEKPTVTAEQWVQDRTNEGTKRLTLDIPASLHKRIKLQCVEDGTTIVDELRKLLEEHYRENMAT